MQDLSRVSFLIVTDAILLMMLVMVLGGCVSTPAQNRYRHGDFIMNIGSAGPAPTQAPDGKAAPQGTTNVATAAEPRRG